MPSRIVRDRPSYHSRKTIPCQIIPIEFFFPTFWQNLRSVLEMASNLLVSQSILLGNQLSKVIVLFRIFLHQYLRYLLIAFASQCLRFQGKEESEQFHYRIGHISYKMSTVLSANRSGYNRRACVPIVDFLNSSEISTA
jgi:hypothetical protein